MRLLVSVADPTEVAAAVNGGADIIDVKNPTEGALGANFPHVIRRVRDETPASIPVSAAIGDVPNLPGTVSLAALGAATCGVQYVKAGLFGVQDRSDALRLLREMCRAVRGYDADVRIIATAYADAHRFDALLPLDLPAVAAEAGVDGCLLDTAGKGAGTLLTHLTENLLMEFVSECRDSRLLSALAGSLTLDDIPAICATGADIVGVRTAACRGDRVNGAIDAEKTAGLKARMADSVSPRSARSPSAPRDARAAAH